MRKLKLGRRRVVLGGLAVGCLGLLCGCGTVASGSNPASRFRRIGVLNARPRRALRPASRRSVRVCALGYVEGRDVVLESRLANGKVELLPELAAELVGQPVDVVVAGGTEAITVLGAAIDGRAEGLFVSTDALLSPLAPRIVAFAEQHRLPAIYATTTYARAGGLLTYGVSIPGNWRRAASYVDKILKGAKPADLPVEQPTTFDCIVNLKAARSIGLVIPESVLALATEVIE